MAMKADGELEFINVVEHGGSRSNGINNSVGPGAYDTSSEQAGQLGFIRQSKHQGAAFFHYIFKVKMETGRNKWEEAARPEDTTCL